MQGVVIHIIYKGTANSKQVEEGGNLTVETLISNEDMINTLQENNKNFLEINTNFKIVSKNLAVGEGIVGKLLKENAVYDNINHVTLSMQKASAKAQELIGSLVIISDRLNKEGTLANELSTDALVFASIRTTVLHLQ